MSKYIKDPSHEDFLAWALKNKEAFEDFYNDQLIHIILDLEQEDYFGTEGFDKRFS